MGFAVFAGTVALPFGNFELANNVDVLGANVF
jgi:hypothetical protein